MSSDLGNEKMMNGHVSMMADLTRTLDEDASDQEWKI